ncbi:MucR family transcriptional regulator [Roseibacterium sp. SDUM158016]|jgi:predicted transcriptional regulator|uniref:MucR family transcriptional regulator n=1 Tax=Roseicyclus sediminis TaxID=2980997 RepID=UPI0021CFF80E|nr:MucR family transcriptional regulator [Roseibacterium sp. SDUM158016]MCU4654348.1 MucR family transcriptional regulator [Roseibacterium sp. SDUM158016]
MSEQEAKRDMLVQIVSVFAARPDVAAEDIGALAEKLAIVFGMDDATDAEGSAPAKTAPSLPVEAFPAVPIDRAVTKDKVYCMCCGKGFKMLKRHIGAEHGLTEAEYRTRFGLPPDFPLVAPSYSELKAKYAKKAGLGKYSRTSADAVD